VIYALVSSLYHGVSLDKELNSTLSLPTQVYKWISAKKTAGRVTLAWNGPASVWGGRSSDDPSCLMLQKPDISTGLDEPSGSFNPLY